MCKHVLNAQVAVRAPCCRRWFDCAECHAETQTHKLLRTLELHLLCKKCKKAFRKVASESEFDESDEYCPYCDNHFVLEAKTAQPVLAVEGEDARIDSRMLKDDRIKAIQKQSVFDVDDDDFADLLE